MPEDLSVEERMIERLDALKNAGVIHFDHYPITYRHASRSDYKAGHWSAHFRHRVIIHNDTCKRLTGYICTCEPDIKWERQIR